MLGLFIKILKRVLAMDKALEDEITFFYDQDFSAHDKARKLLNDAGIIYNRIDVCDSCGHPLLYWGPIRYMGLDRIEEFIQDYKEYNERGKNVSRRILKGT